MSTVDAMIDLSETKLEDKHKKFVIFCFQIFPKPLIQLINPFCLRKAKCMAYVFLFTPSPKNISLIEKQFVCHQDNKEIKRNKLPQSKRTKLKSQNVK